MSQLDSTSTGTAGRGERLQDAGQPTGAGRVGVLGPVLAVLLLAVAAVLAREALVTWGTVGGQPWVPAAVDAADGLAPSPALAAVGVVLVLVGLWVLATGFARRSRRAVAVTSAPGVHVTTRDVARLASGAARSVDGVLSASSSASRRTVTVTVDATSGDVRTRVEDAVRSGLRSLDPQPRVRVAVRAPATDRSAQEVPA
ncbi:DUF6286 domain-containing protein [Kineococcus sp. SYSU DK004]|uniref:DUF6286 domain-containing protein n=1 Tax=Kineococcus sp. SYSU DK004 TaxID=3383125 RepID=UPI003D7EB7FF